METKFDWQRVIISEHGPDSSTLRHILLTLCVHMSAAGESCYPSLSQIQAETGLTRPTVTKWLRKAQEIGWIRVEKTYQRHGGRGRNHYFPQIPKPVHKALIESEVEGVKEDDPVGKEDNSGGYPNDSKVGKEDNPHNNNHSNNQENNQDASEIFKAAFDDYSPTAMQVDRIAQTVSDLEAWREALDTWQLNEYNPWNIKGLLEHYEDLVGEKQEEQPEDWGSAVDKAWNEAIGNNDE